MPATTKKLSRRQWLLRAVAFGAVTAAGGTVALVRTGGYVVEADRAKRLVALAPWQYIVVEHLSARIAAPDRPEDASIPTAEELGVASFIDGYLAEMRPSVRKDLLSMLQYIEHLAPIAAGYAHRFTALSPDDQDSVLRSIESSRFNLLRAGFDGMKSLVMMGYYRHPRSWKIIDYGGPWVETEQEPL